MRERDREGKKTGKEIHKREKVIHQLPKTI